MAGKGGGEQHQQTEWVYFIVAVCLMGACWSLWNFGRQYVVMPAFASNWLMIKAVEAFRWLTGDELGPTGKAIKEVVEGFFDGRRIASDGIDWENFVTIRHIVGSQVKWIVSGIIAALAVVILFQMEGDSFKRVFSLAGGKGRGPSLALEAARKWRTAAASASFDPDGRDRNILPARTPMEWLRDNKIKFENSELDEDAARDAFARQLGKPWHGIAKADLPVQTVLVLCAMHLLRDKNAMRMREEVSVAWAAGGDGIPKMKEIVEWALGNEKIVKVINKVGSKHAYANPVVIAMLDRARAKTGVLPAADFVWMRRVDRDLWYTINNVGRRRFHIEGAGAVAHYQAERVLGSPIPEPHVDNAIEGILDYMETQGIYSIEEFFNRKDELD